MEDLAMGSWPKRLIAALLLATVVPFAVGCSTLFHGTTQQIDLGIQPPGTELALYRWNGERITWVDDASAGTLEIQRPELWSRYIVRATKEEHCPLYWVGSHRETPGYVASGALLGLALVPGLVSILIDRSAGSCCSLDPSAFSGSLSLWPDCEE